MPPAGLKVVRLRYKTTVQFLCCALCPFSLPLPPPAVCTINMTTINTKMFKHLTLHVIRVPAVS